MASSTSPRYGSRALIAGGSEGIGAAFAERLVAAGYDCFLVARNVERLANVAAHLHRKYPERKVATIPLDLSLPTAAETIASAVGPEGVDVLVYNAAASHIGGFAEQPAAKKRLLEAVNVTTPTALIDRLAPAMLKRQRGAVILMSSLAGFQGSGYLAQYAATKAYLRVLAEGLWYEWRERGVDVLAVCAGATATPNYLATDPQPASPLAPAAQDPAAVVEEAVAALGRRPTVITGRGNRVASFFLHRIMGRKRAVLTMGKATGDVYPNARR